jgi:hypothetical protein
VSDSEYLDCCMIFVALPTLLRNATANPFPPPVPNGFSSSISKGNASNSSLSKKVSE